MNAAAIAAALGSGRREGPAWRCRCPLHGGRSLVVRDSDNGRVLVTCWGGCDRLDVLAELRRCGLLDGGHRLCRHDDRRYDHRHHHGRADGDGQRTARALSLWREAMDGADTVVSHYLASRGIVLDRCPVSLRFHARCRRPKDEDGKFLAPLPAMLALVEHVERGPVAVHATYLKSNGASKAEIEKAKAIFGPVAGAAVRFGEPRAGQWLAIAEGIETALSVAVACLTPVWAALSAGGIKNLVLPQEASHVVICADNDASGAGQRNAHDAAARWLAEGRRVRIALPPEPDADFNDMLTGCNTAEINEVHRA